MAVMNLTGLRRSVDGLSKAVRESTGQDIKACYQCGECSGGCPVAFAMDYTPRQIMRLLQLGQLDEALKSDTIWTCAGCNTCAARCPRKVDLAAVMDYLREEAVKRGITPASRVQSDVRKFNGIFLDLVKRAGRMYEVGLIALYNAKSGHLAHDVPKAPALLAKGKLKFIPSAIKGRKDVAAIYERVRQKEGKSSG